MENDFLDGIELAGSITLGGGAFRAPLAIGDTLWISVDYVAGQIFKLNSDARVTIFDADGNVVAGSEGGYRTAATTNVNLFLQGLETGTYYISLGINVAGNVSDTVFIDSEVVTDDFGDGLADATAIATDGTTIQGRLDYNGDVDTFVIDAVAGQQLDFVIGAAGTDNGLTGRRIRLLDENGELIVTEGRFGEFGELDDFSFIPEVSGPITVEISYASTGPGTTARYGEYSFSISTSDVNLIDGTSGADTIRGTMGADDIVGLGGDDIINGLGGDDVLFGNGGHDTIRGGGGNDDIFGEGGEDTLHGGTGADYMSGGAGHDTLYGGRGRDVLDGGTGRDLLYGGLGDDTLNGGTGHDRLYGQNGNDVLSGNAGMDRLFGGAGDDDLYGGADADRLVGGNGSDWLFGGGDNDVLVGGAGNDRLEGDSFDDLLIGGAGADVFVFGNYSGHDTVRDFDVGEDIFLAQSSGGGSLHDFDDVLAAARQVGEDTVIEVGFNMSVTLQGVDIDDLHADMFAFVRNASDYFA